MSSGQVTRSQAAAIRTIFFTKEVYLLGVAGWMETRIDPGTPEIYNNMVAGTEIIITAHIGSREISYVSGYTPVPDLPVVPPSEPVMCELIIGTQIWACYNVETDYPGSKVYGDDETKRSVFGGLYNWTQIMASGFCPEGWHVPTLAEWQTLIDFLGGDATAGGHLKSIEASHWNAPNTGADDSVGFNARGAGVGLIDYWTHLVSYAGQKNYAYLWTADDEPSSPSTHARVIRMSYDSVEIEKTYGNKLTNYLSVRLIKNVAAPIPSFDDWFLPSLDELLAMYDELKMFGIGGFAGLGAGYWSSSEVDAWSGQPVNFTNRGTGADTKTSGDVYVRACRAFTSLIPYSLRDIGPAGGWIFYKNGNDYLECAPVDQSADSKWSNVIGVLIGTTGTAIGTGAANTAAIIAQVGHVNSAAKLCNDYVS